MDWVYKGKRKGNRLWIGYTKGSAKVGTGYTKVNVMVQIKDWLYKGKCNGNRLRTSSTKVNAMVTDYG